MKDLIRRIAGHKRPLAAALAAALVLAAAVCVLTFVGGKKQAVPSAAGKGGPAAVFSLERELLEHGALAERLALGNGVHVLEVAEVSPPEAQVFIERGPYNGLEEPEILDFWDYELTAVLCRVVGSEKRDYRLVFGRRFVSRFGGEAAPCPDDDFPDPKPGDRLLVFDSGTNGISTVQSPLWGSQAHQSNTVVVLDGEGRVTVCLSGTIRMRGSDAVPID